MAIPITTEARCKMDQLTDKLSHDIANLQSGMTRVTTLVDRVEFTIEKLTELSATMSKVLAVQGNRQEMQEKIVDKLEDTLAKQKQDMDNSLQNVYNKIERVQDDLHEDLQANHEKILERINHLSSQSERQHEEDKQALSTTNNRLTKIEKWMWTIVGGASMLVIVFAVFQIIFPLL